MTRVLPSPEAIPGIRGEQLGPTDWLIIDQARVDLFAEATGDRQWIHVDTVRAAQGPYGTTIAHGYLTLSLVNLFLPQLMEVRNCSMGINYGANRIRFPAVVRVGTRVRGRGEVVETEPMPGDGVQAVIRVSVDIEHGDKPACVADVISRFYCQPR